MQITLNGKDMRFDAAPTVSELLQRTGNAGRRVAVEVNRAIVPRSEHGTRCLADGDTVEIVTALGGG